MQIFVDCYYAFQLKIAAFNYILVLISSSALFYLFDMLFRLPLPVGRRLTTSYYIDRCTYQPFV